MSPRRAGGSIFAILAILFLLGFGFVAYAVPQHTAAADAAPQAAGETPLASSTPAAVALGSSLSFAMLPVPVYLHDATPAGYPFKEGGALVVVSGDQLQLKISFVASAKTSFTAVVQADDQNISAGQIKTGAGGDAVFKGNVTLQPGTHTVGLLIFVSSNFSSPVGLSVPRAIIVVLPSGSRSSTTTVSSGDTTTSSASSSTPSVTSQGVEQLGFSHIAIPDAPKGYSYGQGSGTYAVTGDNIYLSLRFTGENPSTEYSLVLSVNGSAKTIGEYTTNAKGSGSIAASAALGAGRFALGLTVVDSSTFDLPTPALASIPSTFMVTASPALATSPSATSAAVSGPEWPFKLEQVALQDVPSGYRFPTTGTAVVSLDAQYSLLDVELGFQDGNPSTTYSAALILNGTVVSLGSMTTNEAGGALLQSSLQVSPGRYLLGVMVYDFSDTAAFKASGPVPVLVGGPSAQLAIVVPPAGGRSSASKSGSDGSQTSSQSESGGATTVTVNTTSTVTTMSGGTVVQAQIQDEVDNLTIPATVQITPLSSSTNVLDPRFSVSAGLQVGNGLVVAISGENVTGSRVLLINMSKTAPLALYPALNITLDGVPVTEASSALQLFDPHTVGEPMYVIVSTSDSIQLLVSIPHFSLHIIQVAGVIVQSVETSLRVEAPLLLGSILVITIAFVGVYATRKTYFGAAR